MTFDVQHRTLNARGASTRERQTQYHDIQIREPIHTHPRVRQFESHPIQGFDMSWSTKSIELAATICFELSHSPPPTNMGPASTRPIASVSPNALQNRIAQGQTMYPTKATIENTMSIIERRDPRRHRINKHSSYHKNRVEDTSVVSTVVTIADIVIIIDRSAPRGMKIAKPRLRSSS